MASISSSKSPSIRRRTPEISVCDTCIVNGATGTNFHRPAFQQMLSDIEAGCVIVKDLSRLGRNSIDTGYYIAHNFHSRNVRFITINERIVFCIRGKPDLVKKCLLLGGR